MKDPESFFKAMARLCCYALHVLGKRKPRKIQLHFRTSHAKELESLMLQCIISQMINVLHCKRGVRQRMPTEKKVNSSTGAKYSTIA